MRLSVYRRLIMDTTPVTFTQRTLNRVATIIPNDEMMNIPADLVYKPELLYLLVVVVHNATESRKSYIILC